MRNLQHVGEKFGGFLGKCFLKFSKTFEVNVVQLWKNFREIK